MTNEQAIRILRNMAFLSGNEDAEKTEKAINMAIEALSCSEKPNNSDLINRQAAIKKFEPWLKVEGYSEGEMNILKAILYELTVMPSAHPQLARAWIEDAKTYYEELDKRGLGVDEYTPYFTDDIACSECLAKFSTIDNETQFFKYCPNCGADMRGE